MQLSSNSSRKRPSMDCSHIIWMWLQLCAVSPLDLCENGVQEEAGKHQILSTLHTGPSGSGAYATQPSCEPHTSAAAWLWLSPSELFYSHQCGLALPRLTTSHSFVALVSRLFLLFWGGGWGAVPRKYLYGKYFFLSHIFSLTNKWKRLIISPLLFF